jgi:hypothetical protein
VNEDTKGETMMASMRSEELRRKTVLADWATRDQEFARAGMCLDTFARLLGDAEDAFDDGDTLPWLKLCDWAEEHRLLLGLVAQTRAVLIA